MRRSILAMGLAFLFAAAAQANTPTLETELAKLVNAGQLAQARHMLARHPHETADALLLEGRILKVQGRADEAIALFEKALRQREHDVAIRRELAHSLYQNGQYNRARFHLERLLREDRNPALQAGYRKFLSDIRRKQPISSNVRFSIEPSTNITRGTSSESLVTSSNVIDISEDSQTQSGVGASLSFETTLRAVATNTHQLDLFVGLSETRYSVDNLHGAQTARIGLTFKTRLAKGILTARPYASKTEREDGQSTRTKGLGLNWQRALSQKTTIELGLNHARQRFLEDDRKTGTKSDLTLRFRQTHNPRLSTSFGVTLERNKTNLLHHRYDGAFLFAAVSHARPSGLVLSGEVNFGQRGFDTRFPLLDYNREDTITVLSIGARNNRWHIGGFSPNLRCSHTINASNVALYDYSATGCHISLSKEF